MCRTVSVGMVSSMHTPGSQRNFHVHPFLHNALLREPRRLANEGTSEEGLHLAHVVGRSGFADPSSVGVQGAVVVARRSPGKRRSRQGQTAGKQFSYTQIDD